ncbi:MAG: transcriptional repressor [Bacteroidota bacterium]
MNDTVISLLKDFNLRSTNCRVEILSIFLDKHFALTQAELEKEINSIHDRVTVYRTLKTFQDKGLIHKVLDDSGSSKYALCKNGCDHIHHHDEHIHFKCVKCGQTNCMENVKIPTIKLPEGYDFHSADLLVTGTCRECQ